jgi:hypothetical protein
MAEEEMKPNPQQAPTHDAQLAAENMTSGEEQVPSVDVDADYEASKAFSVSAVDRTPEGAKAAEAATAAKFEVGKPEETTSSAEPTGDPDAYRDMARDVNPRSNETSIDSDQLVKRATELGQPGK